MAEMICPNPDCEMPGKAGTYCQYCGTELKETVSSNCDTVGAGETPAPAVETNSNPGFSGMPPLSGLPPVEILKASNLPPLPNLPPVKELPGFEKVGGMNFGQLGSGLSGGDKRVSPDSQFTISCTAPETMWRGEISVVSFKFKAFGDYFKDIVLVLRNCDKELARQNLGRRPYESEHGFKFNVKLDAAGGCIAISVDILCIRDGYGSDDIEKYTTTLDVVVRDEKQQSINLKGVNINIGDGSAIYKGFNFYNPIGEDHVQSAAKIKEMILKPELVESPRKLTLVAGDKVLQLLATSEEQFTTFGREKKNKMGETVISPDVLVRVYDPQTKTFDAFQSQKISGIHFRLKPCRGGRLRIFDGTVENPSTNGTMCGDTWVTPDGRCSFAPGSYDLCLGGNAEDRAVGLHLEVYGDMRLVDGFKLTSDDGIDRTWLFAVDRVPVNEGKEFVLWDGRTFMFEDAEGKRKKLYPGMSVSIGNTSYGICVYNKYEI